MIIRKATAADLDEISAIYKRARAFMKESGNGNQWKDHKPEMRLVTGDIEKCQSYVCVENGKIAGVMAFIIGDDPTYKIVYNGKWQYDEPYAVIHRIASSGEFKGTGTFMMEWAEKNFPYIRIDTHRDNTVMQNMLSKLGYKYIGIIHLEDGDERLAFEKHI